MGNHYTEVRAPLKAVELNNIYAYFSLLLNGEEIEEFQRSSRERQLDWLYESGDLIVESYDVAHFGEIEEIIFD